MKILVIGHSIIDKQKKGDSIKISPGGIYYTVLGLLSVKKVNDEIFLVTGYNKSSFHLFENLFKKTNLDFANEIESLPEVLLEVPDDGERNETYLNLAGELDISKINNWNYFDGVLINMITGFDISLDKLKTIRNNFLGTIYFDLHTLSRGVNEKLKREFRQIPNVNEWISNIDILQCNESELNTITQKSDEKEIINFIFGCGLKLLIITRGNKGAEIFYKKNMQIESIRKAAGDVYVVNKIGCGDIFGAVFFYNYLCFNDIEISLDKALRAADKAVSLNIADNINLFLYD